MKAIVTYCESTDTKHSVRLGFAQGSANFEIPKGDVLGDKPEVGDEVEVTIRTIPKPVPVETKPEEPTDLGVLKTEPVETKAKPKSH